MAFKDFFWKNDGHAEEPAPESSAAVDAQLSVSKADIAYLQAVRAANQMMADQIIAGQAGAMPSEQQSWFLAHAGEAANPTEALGLTWYAHQDAGQMQLVDHSMLEMTGMTDPANHPGIQHLIDQRHDGGSPAMKARKDRSHFELGQRGVLINEHLPFVEDADEVQPRTLLDAAQRAFCLMAVAVKAEVCNEGDVVQFHPTLQDIIATYRIEEALTPRELAFVNDLAPDQHTAVQFLWRYEGLWTLLWALGFVDELDYPAAICDVPHAASTLRDLGRDGFMAAAQMRSTDELLDATDFIYRLHWAVRNAQLGQSEPVPGVEPGVVMERHHTLNWLIDSQGDSWDDIDTST